MWIAQLMAALMLIEVHAPDGHRITLSLDEIVSMHDKPDDEENRLFTKNANCLINTSDGKFIAVVESCDQIKAMIRTLTGPEK